MRIVFHASELDENGAPLNSFLHIGPKLQDNVPVVISRWRFHRFVFSRDIVKMFRQFLVHDDDVDWQRILWRFHEAEPVRILRLITVFYGTACAPFLANDCLLQLADDEESRLPLSAQVFCQNSYADDSFAGANMLTELLQTHTQLCWHAS